LPTRPNPRLIFASAIFLLIVCGIASVWTFYRIYSGETWVRHTYAVQVLVGEIESHLARMGRARQTYLQTADKQNLQDIEEARKELYEEISQLKVSVQDNADQESAGEKLEQAAYGRCRTLDESLQLVESGKSTHEAQDNYSAQLVNWSRQTSAIAEGIRDEESRLLDRRLLLTNSLFLWIVAIFAVTFILSLYMLWEHYRGLTRELAQRKLAERNAQNLSVQLMSAQDQERRKIARDLHDGLGQTLVAAKMIADTLVNRPAEKQNLVDLSALLADAVSSTRSMSHLLHPPLVDELGFTAAARTYLEGFSRRTGVKVSFDLPDSEERLPLDLELTLFRVLQEALTNIQRHSKSTNAEVQFIANGKTATLRVRDHGVGLPPELIQNFNANGTNVGVGLAGMKGRVRERNGKFEIRSDSTGTLISATFPVVADSSASTD
jgi:two-component system sensor histidine kinase DegS